MNSALLSSKKMDWCTPQDFFDRLNEEFGFVLDAAATDKTAKCPLYYTPETDGLSQSWDRGGAVFCNPPYGREIGKWVKKAYEEARGIASDMEKAACVWCVLNRVDDPRFPDTVLEVLEAPYQFAGYSADYPVLPELATLAADVLKRYHAEKNGEENVGRVLPAEYLYFTGDGRNNHFTIGWKDAETWDWSLQNPYDD